MPWWENFHGPIANAARQRALRRGVSARGYESVEDLPNYNPLPDLENVYQEQTDLYREGTTKQDEAFDQARRGLTTLMGNIESKYEDTLQNILETTPRNPFTDVERQALEGQAFSNINEQTTRLLNRLQSSQAGRGLSSGGSIATQTATDVGLGEIGARQQARTDLLTAQRETNTAQQRFLAGLEAGMTANEAATLAGLGRAEAGVGLAEATTIDPTYLPSLLGDLTSAQYGISQAEDLNRLLEQAIEAGDDDMINRILGSLSGITTAFGRERVGGSLSALDFLFS